MTSIWKKMEHKTKEIEQESDRRDEADVAQTRRSRAEREADIHEERADTENK